MPAPFARNTDGTLTIDGVLDALAEMTQSRGVVASATVTPSAAAYSANTVMQGAIALDTGMTEGGELFITSTMLEVHASSLISGEGAYSLELYNVTPPSAYADRAAWDIPSGDRAAHLISLALGTPVDKGSTLKIEQAGINTQITVPVGGVLYAYLVTQGAFTAVGSVRKVTLHGVRP